MEFTMDWFNNREVVLNLIGSIKPTKILEIGSFEGLSTSMMLSKAAEFAPVSLYAVDSWEGGFEHKDNYLIPSFSEIERRFDSNMQEIIGKNHNHQINLHKYKGLSHEVLSLLILEKNRFDFIYVDGSHEAADVLIDAVLSFKLLRLNGVIVFDDYEWIPYENCSKYHTPKAAVNSFVECFGDKIVDLYPTNHTYQKYYQKKAE